MIVSHRHQFIFIKTHKTAGSSVEVFLSRLAGDDAIVTPIEPPPAGHEPRNYLESSARSILHDVGAGLKHASVARYRKNRDRGQRDRYWNHMGAAEIRRKLGRRRWDSYFKFTIERNPWEKTISQYYFGISSKTSQTTSFADFVMSGWLPTDFDHYSLDRETLAVDAVMQYDRLRDDLSRVVRQLGIETEVELTHEKAGVRPNKANAGEMFTRSLSARIETVFAREIEHFGYGPPALPNAASDEPVTSPDLTVPPNGTGEPRDLHSPDNRKQENQ